MIRMALAAMLLAVAILGHERAHFRAVPFEHAPLPADAPQPACVTFSTEARFVGLAYNHIVHLANGCDVPQSCTVTTDVNPEPQTVAVPPRSTVQVVTFIGSPARTFTAAVQCSP
jgi:hypothetical protein